MAVLAFILEDAINTDFTESARRHGLNGLWLKEMIILRNKGLKYTEIADKIGVSRDTVSTYVETFGQMEDGERLKLLMQIILLTGGVRLMEEMLVDFDLGDLDLEEKASCGQK